MNNTQVSRLCKAFANNSSANIKLSETQLQKIGPQGRVLGRRLGPLLKTRLPLISNILKTLAKSVLTPIGLTTPAWATNAAIHKTMFGSGFRTLIISNEEMNDIMKIVKSVEESELLIKGVGEAIKNEAKEQKGGSLRTLLGNLGAILLGNLLTGKGTIRAGENI